MKHQDFTDYALGAYAEYTLKCSSLGCHRQREKETKDRKREREREKEKERERQERKGRGIREASPLLLFSLLSSLLLLFLLPFFAFHSLFSLSSLRARAQEPLPELQFAPLRKPRPTPGQPFQLPRGQFVISSTIFSDKMSIV